MKTKLEKIIIVGTIISFLLTSMLTLSSCSSEDATLEKCIDSDKELAQEIEMYCVPGMEMDVDGNTLTYTYKYEQTFDDDIAGLMTKELKNAMPSMNENFEVIKDHLVKKTEISDILIKVVYTDGNDSILYETEY